MSRTEIIEKLKEIFLMVVHNGVNLDNLNEDANIILDLGVNSVGLIYLAVAIEKTFDLDMSEVSANTFKTVKDVVDFIEKGANK